MMKLIVSFCDWFAGIHVEKYNTDGTLRRKIKVPIMFGPRDKFLQIVKNLHLRTDLNVGAHAEADPPLPRMGCNIQTLIYDTIRHTSPLNKVKRDVSPMHKESIYNSVPYNIEIEFTILSKTMDDHFQIVEQIIPYFAPSLSIDVNLIEEFPSESVTITLISVDPDIPEEMDIPDKRIITSNLTFQIKGNFYMPRRDAKVITDIEANLRSIETLKKFAQYDIHALNLEATTPPDQRNQEPTEDTLTEFDNDGNPL
jgi:hypothetical protein